MVAVLFGVAALVVLLGAGGTVAWVLSRHGGGPKNPAGGASPAGAAATWGVGSCIYLSKDFPYATPSVVNPEMQHIIEQSKEYQPVSCSDPRAIARITSLGAHIDQSKPIQDSGCPDDTDMAVRTKTTGLGATSDSQVYCMRNLKAPHPGDPGGGGGGLVVNDCVYVGSSNGGRLLNDQVEELPCADGPAIRTQCVRAPLGYPLVAMADSAAQCPKGTRGHQYTGYDRWLCVRYPDGS